MAWRNNVKSIFYVSGCEATMASHGLDFATHPLNQGTMMNATFGNYSRLKPAGCCYNDNVAITTNSYDTEGTANMAALLDIFWFQYVAWGITGNIISVFGLIGNILSIIVLANRRMKSSTSCYLIALAIFDSIVLISLVLFLALPTVYNATGRLASYADAYPYMQPYAYPTALTAQTCSIYTTVAFTTERYIAVCMPLRAAKMCTISRSRKAIGIIILCSIIYNIPRMLEWKLAYTHDDIYNVTEVNYVQTELGANSTYHHVYFIYMHIIVMLLIPCVMLAVMNTLLIRAVKQSEHATGKVTNKTRRENSLTIMLISVIIVFLICQVPSIVDNILMATLSKDVLDSLPLVKLTCISSLMVITNSASNFYLYCVFGRKFRRVFYRIFCFWSGRGSGIMESETSLLHAPSTRNTARNGQMGHPRSPSVRANMVNNRLQMSVFENGKIKSVYAKDQPSYSRIDSSRQRSSQL